MLDDNLSDDALRARVGCGIPGLQGLVVAEREVRRGLVVTAVFPASVLWQAAYFMVRRF